MKMISLQTKFTPEEYQLVDRNRTIHQKISNSSFEFETETQTISTKN